MENSEFMSNEGKSVDIFIDYELLSTYSRNVKIENVNFPTNYYKGLDKVQYDALKKLIIEDDKISVNNCTIDFNDDIWDFSNCFKYQYASWRKLNFSIIPEGFRRSVKLWIIDLIRNNNIKLPTIYCRLNYLKKFFNELDLTVLKNEYSLTSNDITMFLDNIVSNNNNFNDFYFKIALKSYCEYIVAKLDCGYNINLEVFDKYDYLISMINKGLDSHKVPTIPRDFFNKLILFFINLFEDESASYEHRGLAGIYIIMSQTGLRASEIAALTKDCLEEECEINGRKIYKLRVRSFKRKRGLDGEESKDYYTFANDLTVYVFKKLCELSRDRMAEYGMDFIYLSANTDNHRVLPSWINSRAKAIFVQHNFCIAEDKECTIDGYVNAVKVSKYNKYVYLPTTMQYRVFLCSELYNTYQVPLLWIRKYMGHLSSEMQGYYVRPKDDKHKVVEESTKLLRDILDDKVTLLGDEGSELTNKIKAFIKEGNYNVEKDIDTIFSEFRNVAEVTLKQDGFCTKKKLRRVCDWDEQVSQAHVNFGKFLNNCHVYFMASRSYEDFKLLQRTFMECDSQGYEVEASRELKHLKALCNQRLLPELTDMMAKVEMRGYEAVVSDYPELRPLIDDYDNVYAEVQKWLKKQY